MNPLFPVLPDDLAGLTDEELSAAIHDRLALIDLIEADDEATLADRSAADVLAEMTAGVEQIEALRAEQTSREEDAARYESERAALAARVRADDEAETADETPDETADDAAPEAVAEDDTVEPVADAAADEPVAEADEVVEETPAEPVAAAATPPVRLRRPPRAARSRQPIPDEGRSSTQLVASAGIRGITAGQVLDRDQLAAALIEADRVTSARERGVREQVIVASAHADWSEDRQLGDNAALNTDRINAVVSERALLASGGLCAPLTPLYDLDICGAVPDRPVRDALAGFQATRGGISYPTPLSLDQVEDGVTVVTAEDDELGGTFATKNCVVVDCDPYTDAVIEAISACITHGNFGARSWPERVAALADLLAVQHAKVAEIELLDGLSDGSTAVTDAAVYGATSTLLQGILKAAAAMRNRNRMRPETRLRAILPAWTIDLLVTDIAMGPYDRFERSREGVQALLSTVGGVQASFYLDGPTGASQMFGAQTAGALLDFPTTVVWYLFAEGTWLFLDGGELDLGIVRDSTLNATNDFQVFMETFEGIARVGCQSLEITSTVCPSGAYPAGVTAVTC